MARSKVVVRDRGHADAVARIKAARGLGVSVGVHGEADSSLVVYAASNEFGTEHVPERSFLRRTMDSRRADLAALVTRTMERVARGSLTAERAAELLGAWAQAAVRKTIASDVPPPNAPATIQKKGSTRTLIDTGRLRQGITFQVKRRKSGQGELRQSQKK